MKKILEFLEELNENNNREWFTANKPLYKEIQAEFNSFAAKLIDAVASFDPAVKGLTVKDTTYRIYRDTRFSHDKTPYKTNIGVYICRGGKNSGYAGYYFHVEPEQVGNEGGSFMSSGIYMPEPKVLRSIRDEVYDNGEEVLKAINKAEGFSLVTGNSLKRLPKGYEPGPYDDIIKLKDLFVMKHLDEKFLLQDGLVTAAAREFAKTHALTALLNRAVTYAYEEM